MFKYLSVIAVASYLWGTDAMGFDTETHALMTQAAWGRSVLSASGPGSVINVLGLDRLMNASSDYTPLSAYWDSSNLFPFYYGDGMGAYAPNSGRSNVFVPEAFERCQMQEFTGVSSEHNTPAQTILDLFAGAVSTTQLADPGMDSAADTILPLQNWLIRGTIREDDLGVTLYSPAAIGIYCPVALQASKQGILPRSLNHFYDPFTDLPLAIYDVNGHPHSGPNFKSVDWATGYVDSFANPPQAETGRGLSDNFYTYNDARNMMYWALTRQYSKTAGQPYTSAQRTADSLDRMAAWATSFRALGDVLHLLEDAGQPQHTRNDPHSFGTSGEQKAFEDYVNDRMLGHDAGTGNSPYVQAFFQGQERLKTNLPALTAYPIVTMSSPTRFFSTRGDLADTGNLMYRWGLADYTNRGFFTGGTLPGRVPPLPEVYPPVDLGGTDGGGNSEYQQSKVGCAELAAQPQFASVTCTHYTHVVPDMISPGFNDVLPQGFSAPQVPLVAVGAFSKAINQLLPPGGATFSGLGAAVGPTEFDATANVVIPRTIGYVTGMINFFFRGVGGLAITPPNSGVYAILDDAQPHTMNPEGYPCDGDSQTDGCSIFGFTGVQFNVQNVMPALVETGTQRQVAQLMTSGTLQAVARYHRNLCYQADLSGEIGLDVNAVATNGGISGVARSYPSGCPDAASWAAGRSAYPEISVSDKFVVDSSGDFQLGDTTLNINSQTPNLINFTFTSDPIPINATDLYFEIVFNGTIGDTSGGDANQYEVNSVAVGSVDVSEPTFNTFINLMNYYYITSTDSWTTSDAAFEQNYIVQNYPYSPNADIMKINACSGTDAMLVYDATKNGPANGLIPGHALRMATILDPARAPSGGRLVTNWLVPIGGIYNDETFADGSYVAGILTTTPVDLANGHGVAPFFTARVQQASLESNSAHDYENDVSAGNGTNSMYTGLGITLGDNFYYDIQTEDGRIPNPTLYLPETPQLVSGGQPFAPDPIPTSQLFLNLSLPTTCAQGQF